MILQKGDDLFFKSDCVTFAFVRNFPLLNIQSDRKVTGNNFV